MALKTKTRAQGMPSSGGRYSNAQLRALWVANGGNPNNAGMAAAIALAESGGDANATDYDSNGTVDKGLWQINSVHGSMSTFDPNGNARAAISISNNGSDWSAWSTFQSGAYQQYLDGSSATSTGTTGGGSSQSVTDGSGTKSSSLVDMSLSDLMSSPASLIGDFFALISLGIIKGVADGIGDYIIRPAWNLNLKAVDYYTNDILFDNSHQPWSTLATAAFWAFGYSLLFLDPDSNSLRPAPVRRSRLARHARRAQAIPARASLIKPKHVEERTPTKPTPVKSAAHIKTTGTMNTSRATPVRITGTHANARGTDDSSSRQRDNGAGAASEPIKREEVLDAEAAKSQQADRAGVGTQAGRQRSASHPANEGRRGGHSS